MRNFSLLPLLAMPLVLIGCGSDTSNVIDSAAQPELKTGDGIFTRPYRETTLENGLKVIVVPTEYPDVVTLQIPVQTGSRNEVEPGKSGFAHFFEHMMFRGTEQYPPDVYRDILKNAGADQNAYTSDDLTNYHITFTREDLETVIKLEADRFRNLRYTEEQFRTEALAVKGEYLKNSANPVSKIFERIRDLSFETHPYEHTTMGFFEDIENMPEQFEYSHQFFDRWYTPEQTTVILSGDLDAGRTLELVKQYWGGWQTGEDATVEIPREGAPQGPRYEHIAWDSPTQPWVVLAFRGPAFDAGEKDMPAMDLISALYFSETSDLHRELVIEEQLADSLSTYFPNRKDPNLLMIFARLNEPEAAREVADRILATLARARTELVDADKLADTKSNLKYGFAVQLDNSAAIGSTLASFAHFNRNPVETINTLYRTYDSLTAKDLRQYANRYFTDDSRTIVTLSSAESMPGMGELRPLSERVAAASPATSPAADAGIAWNAAPNRKAIQARRAAQTPPIETVELQSDADLIDVNILFRVGAAQDPANRKGLAALTAMMIAQGGTKFHDINAVNQALYPMAASFSAQVDKEMTSFRGTVHRDNLDDYYAVISEQLLNPGWHEDDFQRIKTQLLNAIRTNLRGNNDEEFGKEALYETLYGNEHPYGNLNWGHAGDVEAVTLDEVKLFYAKHYTSANLMLGLAGGYPDPFRDRMLRDLAALPQGGETALELPAPPAIDENQALIIRKETQPVAVSFGFPIDVVRGEEDWVALWLARSWLGEHRSSNSHLYQRIRTTRGMNYGDYAYIEYFPSGMYQFQPEPNLGRRQQIFQVWLRPLRSNNDAHFATRVAVHELNKLIENGLSEDAFHATRNFLDKYVAQLVSTQGRRLGYAMDSHFYGIGPFTDYVREGLAALKPEDVNNAIRKHLRAEDMVFVYITKDAADLRQRLVNGTPSPVKYGAGMPPEVLAEDRIIEKLDIGFDEKAVRIVPAEQMFE